MRLPLLVTMAAWGANLSAMKLLLERFDPVLISASRMAVAALALALVAWVRHLRRSQVWPRLSGRQWLGLLACAVLMVYVNQLLLVWGVQRTAAANAALIIALNPLVSSLLAAALLGDRLTPARLAGVGLGFMGVAAVVLNRPGASLAEAGFGDLLVLGAVLTWVAGGALVQRLGRGLDAASISTVIHVAGGLMLAAHVALLTALGAGLVWPPLAAVRLQDVVLIAATGLVATAFGAMVWNRALQLLGVARTALYAYWVPIFGVGFAVTWLGEPLTGWHAFGLAAVLSGTWLGTRRPVAAVVQTVDPVPTSRP